MALPPNIPTSFVPHPGRSGRKKSGADLSGAFAVISYFIFGVALLSAIGVFAYGQFLASQLEAKDAELAQATLELDQDTVAHFVRLRDRLNSGQGLLDNHIALTGFLDTLETILPKTVYFSELELTVDEDGNTTLSGSGMAATFNALAATSDAFAQEGHIRDAIFSSISVGNTGSISFSLTATIDSILTTYSAVSESVTNNTTL